MRPLLLAALLLAGCREEAAPPLPVALTPEAVGHYCQMALLEHPGPKAQVHLDGLPQPLFFSQVRDALAYERMPEQDGAILALYVSDMAQATSWEQPGADNWIAAGQAIYVIGSDATGGMEVPELVPFSTRAEAEHFAAVHGGRIVTHDALTDADVLAAPAAGEEDDYAAMLRQLSERQD